MLSMRTYLLRGLYNWICDSGCTPYLVVNANYPGVQVPRDRVRDGQIVLNVADRAVQGFQIKPQSKFIRFTAFFGGRPVELSVPMGSLIAIYAKETGAGMSFPPEREEPEETGSEGEGDSEKENLSEVKTISLKKNRSHLKIVKGALDEGLD